MPVDYSQYHPKWSLISHLVRFVRAKGKCERCGAVHLKPHRITGYKVSLATVHLDHDRKNNDFSNLASLYQWCHLKHAKTDMLIVEYMAVKFFMSMVIFLR